MKNPKILKNFLEQEDFIKLQTYVKDFDKNGVSLSEDFNRYEWGATEILKEYHQKLLPIARDHFESETLVPSFNFVSWYFGNASLEKHKDVNACTYSVDLCVYQKEPWDLYIEGVPYTLQENDAVLYYGEEQRHWREEFPNPEENIVCNVFWFYVEPDHWYITEPFENHQSIKRDMAIKRNLWEA
jgi:hypothetical protein